MADEGKVLVPLDGSKLAEHSLVYVAALQPLGVSRVELISVLEPEAVRTRPGHEDEERERNLLESYLSRLADDLRAQTTLDVLTRVLDGPVTPAILRQVDESKPDYLVVSTHGSSGLSRWRLGSVADKLVRSAPCPTLVIGPNAATEHEESLSSRVMPGFSSILVPLDGSSLAEQALPHARQLAQVYGAQMHLVTAISLGAIDPRDASWAGVTPRLEEEAGKAAGEYLEGISAGSPELARAHIAIRFGPAAEMLTDYVEENGIDLVIMTSHGRGGVLRSALGSTTDRLLGGSAPVLIVRGQE